MSMAPPSSISSLPSVQFLENVTLPAQTNACNAAIAERFAKPAPSKRRRTSALLTPRRYQCASAPVVQLKRKEASSDKGFQCGRCGFEGTSCLSLSMHIAQAHRPRVWVGAKPRSSLEASIYHRLKLLDPEARRMLLSHRFSQAQRLALERWILEQERSSPGVHGHRRFKIGRASSVEISSGRRRSMTNAKQGLPGVICRRDTGRLLYSASGSAGPFRLYTRFVDDHQVAIRFRRVLEAIRRQMVNASRESSSSRGQIKESSRDEMDPQASFSLAHVFLCALAEQPPRHGIDATRDMGLSFTVTVAAGYWVGLQLLTPRFSVGSSADVQAGLLAWKRLNNARSLIHAGFSNRYSILQRHNPQQLQATWERVKEEYLNVWMEAGKDYEKVEARLGVLEERHREHRQRLAARWVRLRMATEIVSRASLDYRQRSSRNCEKSRFSLEGKTDLCGPSGKGVRQIEDLLVCWNKRSDRLASKARKVVARKKRQRECSTNIKM